MKKLSFLLLFISQIAMAQVEMAVTVDDFPHHGPIPSSMTRLEITNKIIKTLKKHGIKETFAFVNYKGVDIDPTLKKSMEAWERAGNVFGNHTYSHMDLNRASAEEFTADILKNEEKLKSYKSFFKVFRYPFLHEGDDLPKRDAIRKFLSENGYKTAQVTMDYNDYDWNEALTTCTNLKKTKEIPPLKKMYLDFANAQFDQITKESPKIFGKQPKHILLVHVGVATAYWLDDVLTAYKKKGTKFIPLTDAYSDSIYEINPNVEFKSGGLFVTQIARSKNMIWDPYPGYNKILARLKGYCQ